MRLNFLLFFLFLISTFLSRAQSEFIVSSIPKEILPEGCLAISFSCNNPENKISLIGKMKDGTVKILYETEVFFFYNDAKPTYDNFNNDTLTICSQYPYKASEECIVFTYTKNEFNYVENYSFDPNEVVISAFETAIDNGRISEAISLFNQIQYPFYYLDIYGAGKNIMEKAYEVSQHFCKNKNYDTALSIMAVAFEFYGNIRIFELKNRDDLIKMRYDGSTIDWNDEQISTWFSFCAEVAIQAKKPIISAFYTQHLTLYVPEFAKGFLLHADAQFQLKNKSAAKEYYSKYIDLMIKQDKKDKIEKRAYRRK